MYWKFLVLMGAGAALSACGGDDAGSGDDLAGVYRVDSHLLSTSGCDALAPYEAGSSCPNCLVDTAFFKVRKSAVFGETVYTVSRCQAADRCDGDDAPDDEVNLDGLVGSERDGDAYTAEVFAAFSGGADCSYSRVDLRLEPTATGVRITRRERHLEADAAEVSLTGDACLDLTEAAPPDDHLTCVEAEDLVGVPVADAAEADAGD